MDISPELFAYLERHFDKIGILASKEYSCMSRSVLGYL